MMAIWEMISSILIEMVVVAAAVDNNDDGGHHRHRHDVDENDEIDSIV